MGTDIVLFAGALNRPARACSPDEGGIAVAGDGPIWEVAGLGLPAHEHIHKAVRARRLEHVQLEDGSARRGRHLRRQNIYRNVSAQQCCQACAASAHAWWHSSGPSICDRLIMLGS